MRYAFVIVAIIALLVLHQNYAIWERDDLVFGFLPYQLAYDGALSILTAIVWLVAVTICWPVSRSSDDQEDDQAGGQS
mgnify:CR=1 FL=1